MTLAMQAASVAAGAARGALVRWAAATAWNPLFPPLPLGTLAANVAGGFAVGVAVAWLAVHPNEWLRLFAVVGVLGGLTTFSTFSAESLALLQRGAAGWALLHAGTHLLGALAAAAAGHALGRHLWQAT